MRRRWLSGESGAGVVEFALVFPVLMLMVFGIIDLSHAFYVRSMLRAAVQDGARVAAILEDPDARSDSVRTIVRRTLTAQGGGTITDGQIAVTLDDATNQITVAITDYEFQFVTPLSRLARADHVLMNYQARSAWERAP